MRLTVTGLCGALALAAGCQSSEPRLRSPHVERFELPPDDRRYTQPVDYPKETLNQRAVRRDLTPAEGPRPGGPSANSGGVPRTNLVNPGMGQPGQPGQ